MAEDKRRRMERHTEDAPPEEVSDDTEAQERSLDDASDRLQDTGGASQETEGGTRQSSIEREPDTSSENSGAQSGPSQEVEMPEVNVTPPETRGPQHSSEGQPQPTGDAPSSDSDGASPEDKSADSPASEPAQQEPQASDAADSGMRPSEPAGRSGEPAAQPPPTDNASDGAPPPDNGSGAPEDEGDDLEDASEDTPQSDEDEGVDAPNEAPADEDGGAEVPNEPHADEDDGGRSEEEEGEEEEGEEEEGEEEEGEEAPDTEADADTPEPEAESESPTSDSAAQDADTEEDSPESESSEDGDDPDAPEGVDPDNLDAPEGADSDNPDAPEGVDADNPDAPADGGSDSADTGSAQSETDSPSTTEGDEASESEDSEESSSDSSPEQPDEAAPDTPDDASGDAPDKPAGDSTSGGGLSGVAGKAGQAVNAAKTLGSAVQAAKSGSAKELAKSSAQMAGRAAAVGVTKFVLAAMAPILVPILLGILALVFVLILVSTLFTSQDDMYTGSFEVQTCDVPPFFASGTTEEEVAAAIHGILEGELGEGEVSDVAVAAFLGNVMQESSMNPQKIQNDVSWNPVAAKDPTYNGYAIGLLQYDGSRRVDMLEHVGYEMSQWSNIHAQLDFMLNHDGEAERQMMRDWLTDTSLTYADLDRVTEEMVNNWWRAGMPRLQDRQDYADYWHGLMGTDEHSNLRDANLGALLSRQSADCNYGMFGDMLDSVPANGKDGSSVAWGLTFEELQNDYPEYFKHLAIGPFTREDEVAYLDDGNGYRAANRGQCTELTFGYMRKLWSAEMPPKAASGSGLSEGHRRGHGGFLYKAYEQQGAHLTFDPTVGYGFSTPAHTPGNQYGHTGTVVGVMPDGSFIIADYNSDGNAFNHLNRNLRYHIVNGNRSGPISSFTGDISTSGSDAPYYMFFSGLGEPVGGFVKDNDSDSDDDEN